MRIVSFTANSFDGQLVSVEVDIRRGIPGMDIIGLPDGAVLESRERIRAALRNSGFEVPKGRILINLAPAGIRKEGASFDLAIAAAILFGSGAINGIPDSDILILGELMLSGEIRPVTGVLSAVSAASSSGIRYIIVPEQNKAEAQSLDWGLIGGIDRIGSLPGCFELLLSGKNKIPYSGMQGRTSDAEIIRNAVDFEDIFGLPFVKRALVVAAAGRHNVLLFGPPGGGKTLCGRALGGILPRLERKESIEVTRIYSAAGMLPQGAGLLKRPPFREPHHSASEEGLIGGGRSIRPGEISLAHRGVLFLDETPEFSKNLLQALREPAEEGRVDIARAGKSCIYPADFQLILAANPCPCGNLGRKEAVCVCSRKEIMSYWKKMGGALLDRIDIRIPVEPAAIDLYAAETRESSSELSAIVSKAVDVQKARYRDEEFSRNGRIPAGRLKLYCTMTGEAEKAYIDAVKKLRISSRACVSVIKTARTIADLRCSGKNADERINRNDLLEAVQHRRYGEHDFYWEKI